jgi:hypothetical protein
MGSDGVGADPATAAGHVALVAPVPGAPIVLVCLIWFSGGLGEPRGALGCLVVVVGVFAQFSGDGIEDRGSSFRVFVYAGFKAIISGLAEASLSLSTVFRIWMCLEALSVRRRGSS